MVVSVIVSLEAESHLISKAGITTRFKGSFKWVFSMATWTDSGVSNLIFPHLEVWLPMALVGSNKNTYWILPYGAKIETKFSYVVSVESN